MKCPVCNDVRMREVQKDDVLIDICPDCKGVWLDRGELEKIIKGIREEQKYDNRSNEYDERYDRNRDEYFREDRGNAYSKYDRHGYPPRKKRKKSMIDIFSDFL